MEEALRRLERHLVDTRHQQEESRERSATETSSSDFKQRRHSGATSGTEESPGSFKGHPEDARYHQDPEYNSTVSRSAERWGDSAKTLSRRKRTYVFPFYMARNVITFFQVLIVLARKCIVVGSYFYNKINIRE